MEYTQTSTRLCVLLASSSSRAKWLKDEFVPTRSASTSSLATSCIVSQIPILHNFCVDILPAWH